ncbi:MAG: SdrD B-like domain-containing protein [Tepidisphaeraceae bacterium]
MKHQYVEPLESRRLMSVSLGVNLLQNGDAETGIGASTATTSTEVPGWTKLGGTSFTLAQYNSVIGPTDATPGPDKRGKNFFAGGPVAAVGGQSRVYQDVDLSSISDDIDAGRIRFNLSAYLGGYKAEADSMALQLHYFIANKFSFEFARIEGFSAADRSNQTGLYPVSVTAGLPKGTRSVRVFMIATKQFGRYADGFADNVSLKLESTGDPKLGFIKGTTFDDPDGVGGLSLSQKPMGGVTVYVDSNKNGRRESGEPYAVADSGGKYQISKVPAGSHTLREILPSGYRVSSKYNPTVRVNGGLTTTQNFFNSQTGRIAGFVFRDTNRNGRRDAGEKGISNHVLFLDYTDNGEIDSFEPYAKTNANGEYSFSVPHGTYHVRRLYPEPVNGAISSNSILVSVKKAQTVREVNFKY